MSLFIRVDVDPSVAGDTELAQKLEDACPVDIFAASESGVEVVEANQDECVLCGLCLDAAPDGAVTVTKLYDGTTL
ncbi:MAG: ferredoxin family protein [Actinomycetota bacterium]|nr:ferredoxin family protein [Actinomycetota bacterium]